ncbi:hypothetical protein Hamer_G006298 [Homarus americanus]|uniref:Uncharacterized protein n=1 Tax=Homarus americanus TaxID=6706 RepID=A0A8J5JNP0_HOMAM|nr:hypothetical protein Hamer_G006298 [Homarus americanus]
MKFLVGLVLCLPTVLGRPADKTKTTEVPLIASVSSIIKMKSQMKLVINSRPPTRLPKMIESRSTSPTSLSKCRHTPTLWSTTSHFLTASTTARSFWRWSKGGNVTTSHFIS